MIQLRKRLKIWQAALVIIFIAVLLLILGCCFYVQDYYHADESVLEAAAIDDSIAYDIQDRWFTCGDPNAQNGLVFYPGAKVEETAYLPLMAQISRKGMFCVVVRMPARLAILDSEAAGQVMEAYPAISSWYLGGHSLGGAMAASYASKHEDEISGLLLLAAYSTQPLADRLPVLSLFGSEDHVLNQEKYRESLVNLPAGYTEYVIDGGNHAGFGGYGPQKGDGNALISKEEQWRVTADTFAEWVTENEMPDQ